LALLDARYRGVPVRVAQVSLSSAHGPLTVRVAEYRARRSATQQIMLYGKLLVDFAEIDLTLLIVWVAVYWGLQSLNRLRQQVETRSPTELRPFDSTRVPGELRPVVTAINHLLELLRESTATQQRFIADAAHQLRTPIAGLQAQVELLAQDNASTSIAPQLKTLERGIRSLARSATQLLALARTDPVAAAHADFKTVELSELAQQLVEKHVERAERAGIDLGAEIAPAAVGGSASLLQDLLENLVDNAIKYCGRGGRATVRCGPGDGTPFLEVEDDGPGIPESERRRVRERFYRLPGAGSDGAGLGLAIVDEIARLHGAEFTIGDGSQGRGVRMRVAFRRAPIAAC